MALDYLQLQYWRKHHSGWRFLLADNAPLIAAFLDQAFIASNERLLSQSDLCARLDDFLFHVHDLEGEALYPRKSLDYLDEWAHHDRGWLRKFYPPGSDEPYYDLTPMTEKTLRWLESFNEQRFVGTESRLLMVFELLRQMVRGSETDVDKRIADLRQQKKAIEQQIKALKQGELALMDSSALKDRFMQFQSTARELLSDFRMVEHNFRQLDRQVREQIAGWSGQKGDLLQQIFGERDAITDTDQGKSFQAFWDFLMSPDSQEELNSLLDKIYAMENLGELRKEERFKRIHYDWLEAGEFTQRTVARLSQQLRRFLDDQAWLDNKRIIQLLDSINGKAVEIRDEPPSGPFMTVSQCQVDVTLPMDRPLFTPPQPQNINTIVESGTAEAIDLNPLFQQKFIDKKRLMANIKRVLQKRKQASLGQIIAACPVEEGLAELVTYISLAAEDKRAIFDSEFSEQIRWQDAQGKVRQASIPQIIFNQAVNSYEPESV